MLKNKRIFISGGSGVIGKELVQRLHARGAILLVGDLQPRPLDWPQSIAYWQGDLNFITQRELDNFAPELFFHLAATFERSAETYEFWNENFHHNVQLSHHLMSLLKDSPSLKKVVFASSYLLYSKALYTFAKQPSFPYSLKETDRIDPRNLTGSAKLNHEVELNFLQGFKGNRLHVIHARIFRSYGRDSRDVISRWVRALLNNEHLTVFNKENVFDFIFAGDVAEGLLRLAESTLSGVVNLGTGLSRSISDVVNILKQHFPNMRYEDHGKEIFYEASQADVRTLKSITHWTPQSRLEDVIPKIIVHERGARRRVPSPVFNVLITSVSRKAGMVQAVKSAMAKAGNTGILYGADVNRTCLGRHFVDAFWKMPKTTTANAERILEYCLKHGIQLILPSRDGELEFWAQQKQLFAKRNIHIMISNPKVVRQCVDKLAFYREGRRKSLPVVQTSEALADISGRRFVVKERCSAGSRGLALDVGSEEARRHAATLAQPIYQPFISGKEYSVDFYVTRQGKLKGSVVRERNLVLHGESQITTTVSHTKVAALCPRFIKAFPVEGHCLLQIIVDTVGDMHVLECNARFGGASTASVAAGLDSFYWLMLEAGGTSVEDYPFLRAQHELRQVRFPHDMIVSV